MRTTWHKIVIRKAILISLLLCMFSVVGYARNGAVKGYIPEWYNANDEMELTEDELAAVKNELQIIKGGPSWFRTDAYVRFGLMGNNLVGLVFDRYNGNGSVIRTYDYSGNPKDEYAFSRRARYTALHGPNDDFLYTILEDSIRGKISCTVDSNCDITSITRRKGLAQNSTGRILAYRNGYSLERRGQAKVAICDLNSGTEVIIYDKKSDYWKGIVIFALCAMPLATLLYYVLWGKKD